jgi:thiamine-phosphate diphosphorylase
MCATLPRIWLITDPTHPDGPVVPLVRALDGCPRGVVGIQLRAKDATDREIVAWGRALRAVTADAGALLTVNRRPDVAEIVGADGVHLPERSLAPQAIRAAFPEIGLIGASRHDRMGLERATEEALSFAFLSPVFPVPEKGEPLGIGGFADAIAHVAIPTYALGGIELEHIRPLVAAGAWGVALRRAIYGAPEPAAALLELLDELDKALSKGE